MNIKSKFIVTAIASACSLSAYAGSYSVEARGDAMGGVGVVSATYLTAPFYNPALVAIYRRNDDAGMILPGLGLNYDDQDNMVDTMDGVADLIDKINGGGGSASDEATLQSYLDDLDGSQLKVELGAAAAIGIPNSYLSMNIFGKAYAETFVTPDVDTTSGTTLERAENTKINAVSVAVTEAGLNMGKYINFLGQHMAVGISPKLQRIYTYVYQASVDNFDLADVAKNNNAVNTFNIDTGVIWFYGPMRVGLSGRNLISKTIETNTFGSGQSYEYKLEPQYTLGVGLVADYATISVDYDLNELDRYVGFDDNTQMLRVGAELDILRQLKLRVGYMKNLAYEDSEETFTAGIGLAPLGLFEIDIAGTYTNEDAMGAYVNFLATY
ncbi:conjugal transfer protein TraF [Vibrio sp.]|uniref:Type IX secretion system membrane protein PorP/SprF n=1 Tax=Vibrio viridaestus TaxID=2487322 RepID=A0A3N9TCA9_9VIBR|nr:conjugal transfer protein TraF [Vibrio viridaestus]MDC0612610.1 conjugal transfer protein TraF [Vibrio sp.]RQW61791.1 type IX secretion system membrane protein PorP/SprF [Vibrio viridaestus]